MALRLTTLARTGDVALVDVQCTHAASAESRIEAVAHFEVVLPVAGAFHRAARGSRAVVDPTAAYFSRPGDEQDVTHPAAGGDRCLAVVLSERAGDELGLDRCGSWLRRRAPHDDVAVARLAAAARRGHAGEAEERALVLVAGLLGDAPARRTSGAAAARRVVDDARAAIAAEPSAPHTLRELAARAGYAPAHFSRLFSVHAGTSVTAYRRRVRLAAVLERLREGDDLASAAAATGFADHAHLTRSFRRVYGTTPSALRRELA